VFSRTPAALVAALWLIGAASASDSPLRDPTEPYRPPAGGARTAVQQRYVLTAVLVSASRRVAVVNGLPCMVGDTVDGAEIVRIEAKQVHVRRNGRDIVLRLQRPGSEAQQSEGDSSS
jgi:hypothetical protein